jgi:hypothetical protein
MKACGKCRSEQAAEQRLRQAPLDEKLEKCARSRHFDLASDPRFRTPVPFQGLGAHDFASDNGVFPRPKKMQEQFHHFFPEHG